MLRIIENFPWCVGAAVAILFCGSIAAQADEIDISLSRAPELAEHIQLETGPESQVTEVPNVGLVFVGSMRLVFEDGVRSNWRTFDLRNRIVVTRLVSPNSYDLDSTRGSLPFDFASPLAWQNASDSLGFWFNYVDLCALKRACPIPLLSLDAFMVSISPALLQPPQGVPSLVFPREGMNRSVEIGRADPRLPSGPAFEPNPSGVDFRFSLHELASISQSGVRRPGNDACGCYVGLFSDNTMGRLSVKTAPGEPSPLRLDFVELSPGRPFAEIGSWSTTGQCANEDFVSSHVYVRGNDLVAEKPGANGCFCMALDRVDCKICECEGGD